MQTCHSLVLSERFGQHTALAIAEAYAAVTSVNVVGYDDRLAMIRALICEADAGRLETDHLYKVASSGVVVSERG